MTTLRAKNLTIGQVHHLLGFTRLPNGLFTPLLTLEQITEFEQQELNQIREDFLTYLLEDKVSEELVKALTTYPLLRLAGFYRFPIKLSIEQNVETIVIEDEDTDITARLDILAFNKTQAVATDVFFWMVVIESKNSSAAPSVGLPQLLTYAYKSLEHQAAVWGLITNGELYQFVYMRQADRPQADSPAVSPTYQLMPILSLMEPQPAVQLLQVLRAICCLSVH